MKRTVQIPPRSTSSPANIIISFATEVVEAARNVLDSWVALPPRTQRAAKYFYFHFWHNKHQWEVSSDKNTWEDLFSHRYESLSQFTWKKCHINWEDNISPTVDTLPTERIAILIERPSYRHLFASHFWHWANRLAHAQTTSILAVHQSYQSYQKSLV